MIDFLKRMQDLLNKTRKIEGIAPLAFRLFLAPVFILAGLGKLTGIENTANYFGFLGIPAPTLMAYLAGLAEFVGGILLVPGIAVRWGRDTAHGDDGGRRRYGALGKRLACPAGDHADRPLGVA